MSFTIVNFRQPKSQVACLLGKQNNVRFQLPGKDNWLMRVYQFKFVSS